MKRWTLRILLLLLLGAMVNVAVAWGLALTVHANTTNPNTDGWEQRWAARKSRVEFDGHTHWHVREFSKPGSSLVVVTCVGNPQDIAGSNFDDLLPPVLGIEEVIAHFEEHGPSDIDHPGYLYWDGRGWPLIAMSAHWGWFHRDVWPNPPIEAGLDLSRPKAAGPWPYDIHELHALPLRLIWPGFAINTFFYAAILWLLFF